MKYKIIFLLFTIFNLTSCDVIYFDRMPGQLLTSFPDKLVGDYRVYDHKLKDGKFTVEMGDDSVMTINKTSLNIHDKEVPLLSLNDTFTVSEYKGYYFISWRQPPSYWECFIFQETKNGFIGCAVLINQENSDANASKKDQSSINEVKKYFPGVHVITMKNSDGIEGEEFYTKMNEDQVIAFFKDEVKKPEYSEFVKR